MTSIKQITLRLPQDLARRLASSTPSRKRNQFVVDLVRRELDRESRELEEAAQRLTALEKATAADEADWLSLDDDQAWAEFDEERFLKELSTKATQDAKPVRAVAA